MQFKMLKEGDIRLVQATERFKWHLDFSKARSSGESRGWLRLEIDTGWQGSTRYQPLADVTIIYNRLDKETLANRFNLTNNIFDRLDCPISLAIALSKRIHHQEVEIPPPLLIGSYSYQGSSREILDYKRETSEKQTVSSLVITSENRGFLHHQAGLLVLPLDLLTSDPSYHYDNIEQTIETMGLGQAIENLLEEINLELRFDSIEKIAVPIASCTIENNEFLYSTNPTFTDSEGQIRTLQVDRGSRRWSTYITTISLWDINRRLLALVKIPPTRNDNSTILNFNLPLFLRQ